MMKTIRFILILSGIIFLLGCDEKHTYPYYMKHLDVLKKAMVECESQNEKSKQQALQCEMVMYAAGNIVSLINEQQSDPELFGQRVLTAQIENQQLKLNIVEIENKLNNLKRKQASSSEISSVQKELLKLKQASAKKSEEVKTLLAVLGLGSPS